MKRTLSRVLCLAMLLSMLLPGGALAENTRPTVVITIAQNTLTSDYEDNYFTKYVEDLCNVNLEFQFLPATDTASKLALMVSAEENLGDALIVYLDNNAVISYANEGALQPMNAFYDKYDTNVEAYDAENNLGIMNQITMPDGNIYFMPSYIPADTNSTKYRAWINQKWLTNLGLQMPTTPEELYTVLKAFKEQDANGNGDPNDEIPMLGCVNAWSASPLPYLISMFTYCYGAGDGWGYQITDGKINFMYTEEAYREALRYINKLVSEGLLAADTWTLSGSQYKEYCSKETATTGVVFGTTTLSALDLSNKNVNDYDWLPYMKNADGKINVSFQPYDLAASPKILIPRGSANPELVFKMADALFSVDTYIRCRFGEEGIHYDIADASHNEAMQTKEWLLLEKKNFWGENNNMSWHLELGLLDRMYSSLWNGDPNFYNYKRYLAVQDMVANKPGPGEFVPPLSFTGDEIDEYSEMMSSIGTYWRECTTLFILGEMNLDTDWDSYLKTLNEMGLEKYLSVVQGAYDRVYAK